MEKYLFTAIDEGTAALEAKNNHKVNLIAKDNEKVAFTAVDEGMAVLEVKDTQKANLIAKGNEKVVITAVSSLTTTGIPYMDSYEITPTMGEQVLSTRSKTMRDDVTVHAIPFTRTTNASGGYTAIIAAS